EIFNPLNRSGADYFRQYFGGVVARIDLVVNARDLTLLVDEIADAPAPFGLRVVARSVCDHHLPLGVAQQRERELLFCGEGGIVLDSVEAGADHLDAVVVEILDLVAEPAAFGSS